MPPARAISVTDRISGTANSAGRSPAHRYSAGSVNIAPAANDSPALPMVCTMLFSRMESRRRTKRSTPIEITAAGTDAETVSPTRSPR